MFSTKEKQFIERNVFDTGTIIRRYYPIKRLPKRYREREEIIQVLKDKPDLKGLKAVITNLDDGTSHVAFYVVEEDLR